MTEIEIPSKATPDEITERAVGMIAVAMLRASNQSGPAEAVRIGQAVTSVIGVMTMDFRRAAAKETP